ncbi:MAG: ABC transporter permease [Pirellulales bacterium]
MNAAAIVKSAASRAPFAYWHETTLALLLGLVFVVAGTLEPRFIGPSIQVRLAGESWCLALVALPMAMIVITAGIDLSVGSMVGLAAVVLGLAFQATGSMALGAVAAVVTGVVAGLFNGLLIARGSIHPLIATLATMAVYRGFALALTKGVTISGFPASFAALVQRDMAFLPLPIWLIVIASIAAALFLGRTAYGRFLYAIGHNETAALFSGIPVARIKLVLYTLSGLAAGIGAVLLASRYGQVKADFATGLELEVITAVVLGGVSIFGGRGNIAGVILGLALLHECTKFVPWHWHISELNALVTGGLLIAAVLLNSLIPRRSRY